MTEVKPWEPGMFKDSYEQEFFEDTGIPVLPETVGFFSAYLAGRIRGSRAANQVNQNGDTKLPRLFQPKVDANPDVVKEQQTSS